MKLEKDGVVKDIEDRLVSDYILAGWKKEQKNHSSNINKNKDITYKEENKNEQ
ncbi:MAG: hypothetical protein HFJ48_01285 [Clostridia bacterium]|nr:hypothetical protein [Clostridia bacterium]